MRLDPGKYKIFVNDGPFGSTHFLYVYLKNGKIYYRLDHGAPQLAEGDAGEIYLEHTRVIKQIRKPVNVKAVKVRVTFRDEDGDEFNLTARSIHVLRRIFRIFPDLIRKFQ